MRLENNYDVKLLTTQAATGGTITTSGDYRIHTFTTSGTLVVNKSITADILVVAGGAGGGGSRGGGGGAGGYIYNSSYAITTGSKTVTIGNGGNGGIGAPIGLAGANGGNSMFHTLTIIGGGGGGGAAAAANAGGSGGGGANAAGAAGTVGQGYAGGTGAGTPHYGSGGGGGAGGIGANGLSSGTSIAAGGLGISNSISGSSVTYATGGVGGHNDIRDQNGATASANTGNGGGGAQNLTVGNNGGAGGSGIVIIRYISYYDVTATNMTITQSENPCRTGVCTITVNVTWTNNNPTSTSSFVPAITVSSGTVTTYSSQTLAADDSITLPFTVSGMTAGTCTICPYPN